MSTRSFSVPPRSYRVALPALLAACLVVPAIACSSSEEPGAIDDPGTDSGKTDVPSSDAGDVPDAAKGPDADAGDAGPRLCSDDGFCHTQLPEKSYLRDVWSAGDGVVWAVGWNDPIISIGGSGIILRWDDSGWSVAFKIESRLHAIWGSSATDIWVGGDDGLFHGTGASSAAITWTKVRSEPIWSIWGTGANDVWAVGATKTYLYSFDGKVLHYGGPATDGSDGWTIDPISSRPASFRKIWGTSTTDVWLGAAEFATCGDSYCDGTRAFALRRRSDGSGGFTWSEASTPDFVGILPATGVHTGSEFSGGGSVADGGAVWMMGSRAQKKWDELTYDVVFIGTPKNDASGDYAWSEGTFGTCNNLDPRCRPKIWWSRAVWGKSASDIYIAGDRGQLRHWNGSSFSFPKTTLDQVPLQNSFWAIWGSSDSDLWLVGDQIALHKRAPRTIP